MIRQISSVLQKLELYLARDETWTTEIQRFNTGNQHLRRNVADLEYLTIRMQDHFESIHKRLLDREQANMGQHVVISNVVETKTKSEEDCEHIWKTVIISEMEITPDRIYICGSITGHLRIVPQQCQDPSGKILLHLIKK